MLVELSGPAVADKDAAAPHIFADVRDIGVGQALGGYEEERAIAVQTLRFEAGVGDDIDEASGVAQVREKAQSRVDGEGPGREIVVGAEGDVALGQENGDLGHVAGGRGLREEALGAVYGGEESRHVPELLALRRIGVLEAEACPVAPAAEPAGAEEVSALEPVGRHAPEGLRPLPARAVVVVVLAVEDSGADAWLPVVRRGGQGVEVHLVGVAVAVAVVVHAAHAPRVRGDGLADELVVGAAGAGDP